MTASAAFQPGAPITPPPNRKATFGWVKKATLVVFVTSPRGCIGEKQTWVTPAAAQIQPFYWGAVVGQRGQRSR